MVTKGDFPNPESFEPETKKEETFVMKKSFIYYIFGISLFAFGFMDYALVIMHISKNLVGLGGNYENFKFISQETLPLLYAGAMLVDALAALVFGHFYDKKGVRALVISTIISAPFSFFIFGFKSELAILFGLVLWGIGMGAQESILKAAVTSMVPKKNRATGYGIFECSFGIFWFLGSWLLGLIYSASLPLMIGLSILAQLMAIPFYLRASRAN